MTFVEGASVFSASSATVTTVGGMAVSGEVEVTCTADGNGGEVDCVQNVAVSAPGFASEGATNFLATTSPIFTISGAQVSSSTGTQNFFFNLERRPLLPGQWDADCFHDGNAGGSYNLCQEYCVA